ncbi:sensor domain-containing diguanylate cyclase [Phytohalomonas tamaricis]|uniref:sensor domain-containing diguanylate cyclase n=1 Tax=Phytohalomonas tamaricis TaxID=2081032 RepID=UPI0021D4804A|nr:sensor domain-containing diguanylate cyclase [Phytohalomonas tamaricis]
MTSTPCSSAEGMELQMRTLIDSIQEFIVLKDGTGRWLFANKAVIEAHDLHAIEYVGKTDLDLAEVKPEAREIFEYNTRTDEQAWQEGAALRIEKSFMGLDQRINTWEVIKTPTFDEAGKRHQLLIVSRNITERKLIEEALHASEQKYRLLAENTSDIIGISDPDGRLSYLSPAFERQLGYAPADFIDACILTLIHPDDHAAMRAAFQALVTKQALQRKVEYRCHRAQGDYLWLEVNMASVFTAQGRLGYVVFTSRDISERKQYDQYLRTLAYNDALTGIANRRLLMDRLQQEIKRIAREDKTLAVLYLDLDHFKAINDTHGHDIGDELLLRLAERIESGARSTDLCARIGGDEFVVVLPDVDEAQVLTIAERLYHALQQPWSLSCGMLQTTSSIGVALYHPDDSAHTLLRHADEALYQAKRAGRAQIKLFTLS